MALPSKDKDSEANKEREETTKAPDVLMDQIYTLPSKEALDDIVAMIPDHMAPSHMPNAVVASEIISSNYCDRILSYFDKIKDYSFPGCGARTKEIFHPLDNLFSGLISFVKKINDEYWKFALYDQNAAWLQSYSVGSSYMMHRDGSTGQSRKLTAVVLLTHPSEYEGGKLTVVPHPEQYEIPREKGTVVIFPSWLLHEVSEVTKGTRHSLNLGFWGPDFK